MEQTERACCAQTVTDVLDVRFRWEHNTRDHNEGFNKPIETEQ
jgi:hypothetical protein